MKSLGIAPDYFTRFPYLETEENNNLVFINFLSFFLIVMSAIAPIGKIVGEGKRGKTQIRIFTFSHLLTALKDSTVVEKVHVADF